MRVLLTTAVFQMMDCAEAHKILLKYIASDFAKFSALPEWSSPLLGAATYRKVMEVKNADPISTVLLICTLQLVPAAEVAAVSAPQVPGNVEVCGHNQIQGTTRAAEIAGASIHHCFCYFTWSVSQLWPHLHQSPTS